MEITYQTLLLAFGLGLLGFIEPCTIGAHMLFLGSQQQRPLAQRLGAALVFLLTRLVVMSVFGGAIVYAGQRLISVQTTAWLIFGVIYFALGVTYAFRLDGMLRHSLTIAPLRWKSVTSPGMQGFAFGLNIPACAAPILFALIGTATVSGSAFTGFMMMAVFAFGLSLPLLPMSAIPVCSNPLERVAQWLRPRRWLMGTIFLQRGHEAQPEAVLTPLRKDLRIILRRFIFT